MNRVGIVVVFISSIAAVCCWMACGQHEQNSSTPIAADTIPSRTVRKDISVTGSFSPQTKLHLDSSSLPLFFSKYPLFKPLQKDIQEFYSTRKYAYAWYDTHGMIEQADNLYNHILHISEEGLPDKNLYKDQLDNIFGESSPERNPENELMLTAQYFDYVNKVWGGLSEKQTRSMNWFLPRKELDLNFLMDSLLRDTSSSLIKKGYSFRQYALLKSFLKKYRDIETKNKWKAIRSDRKAYKLGDSSVTLQAIRERLILLGDMNSDPRNSVFDEELEQGVKNYQHRFGVKEDGVIGPQFLNEINQPLDKYIRQIIVNMERCRWIPVRLEGDYLIVNIPAFVLSAYDNDSLVFNMKVVVGKSLHKTVIFNGDLKYIVFSPYWNVPASIMKKEIIPALQKDPNYLKKNNMEWNGKSIRQKPGPNNALGLVKFLFPNNHDIYLHDSPAKNLFNEDIRAFSHGCIRVAEPKKLAAYLLRKDPQWTDARIVKAMNSGKEQYVTLKDPVPVFIAYLTSWVDKTGKLNLRKDIYQRDNRLEDMLMKN